MMHARPPLLSDRRGASSVQMLIVLGAIALGGIVAFKALGASQTSRTDCAGKRIEAFSAAVPCSDHEEGPGTAAPSPPPPAPEPQPEPEKFDPQKEILNLLADILGITDAKKCFTEGDILACVMTFANFTPFKALGTAFKVVKNIPRIKRAIEAFNAFKKAKKAEEDARRAEKIAREAKEAKEAREAAAAGKKCKKGKCEDQKKCFAAGTPVETEDGPVAIEELQPGDMVWSRDDESDEEGYRPIARIIVTPEQPLMTVALEDAGGAIETIDVTAPHPFQVEGRGWVPAGELEPGDQVVTADGGALEVASTEDSGRSDTVYNFEVEEFHTYFVGQGAAWVHNDCDKDALAKKRAEILECLKGFLQDDPQIQQIKKAFPDAKFGLGGSVARGTVGNPNKPTFGQPFDPNKFDLDFFVVSDSLPQSKKVVGLQGMRDRLVGRCPAALAGLKAGGEGLSVKVFRSSDALDPAAVLF
jgi:hypothetical protein